MASFEFFIMRKAKDSSSLRHALVERNDYMIYHGLCEIFYDLTVFPCTVRMSLTNPSCVFTIESAQSPDVILSVWEEMQKAGVEFESRRAMIWVESLREGCWNKAHPSSGLACFKHLCRTLRQWTDANDAETSDDDKKV
jgi:hypothetical protein